VCVCVCVCVHVHAHMPNSSIQHCFVGSVIQVVSSVKFLPQELGLAWPSGL